MKAMRKPLSELHETKKNIRRHSERQIAEYIRSLKMFGQIRPLVVTEDGEILVGNGMFRALTEMGETECDVYVVEGLTKAQKRKLMLADNKVYELGFTVVDALDDLLKELDGDFDVPGYDSDLLDMLAANPVEAGEEAKDYGTAQPSVTAQVERQEVRYSEDSGPQYAPPVKTESGAFVAPVSEEPQATEERKFIVCPHCGEKIWL